MSELIKNYFPILPQPISKTIGAPITRIFTQLFPKISHNFQVQYGDVTEYQVEINKIRTVNHSHNGVNYGRTQPFIQWRFSAPEIQSKCLTLWDGEMMLAYLILDYPVSKKSVLIEDIFALKDDEYLISILVSEAVAILKKANVNLMWTYLIEREGNHSKIFSRKHGFIYHSSDLKTLPMARFLYFPLKDDLYNEIISDEKQWNLMVADFWFFEKNDY